MNIEIKLMQKKSFLDIVPVPRTIRNGPEICANSMRCLINIVTCLLRQQIQTLE